jgi:hypothetical protein
MAALCDNNKINILNRGSRLHRIFQRCLCGLLVPQNKVKLPNEPTL